MFAKPAPGLNLRNQQTSNAMAPSTKLSPKDREQLLKTLKDRFEKNKNRHKGIDWSKVQAKLEANADKLWSLSEMEKTGGEPDVVGQDKKTGEFIFYDCAAESPKGRRSLCYDRKALNARKENKPADSALDMAAAMGIEILTEEQYRDLQKLGNVDARNIQLAGHTGRYPETGRRLSATIATAPYFFTTTVQDSYYAARGFRGSLKV